jgi:hypothetical protein
MVSCYVINIKKLATALDIGNGVNAIDCQLPVTAVHGLLYFVPNPALHGYTDILGEDICVTAISNQSGENATQFQKKGKPTHGSVYFVQNQLLQGYADI